MRDVRAIKILVRRVRAADDPGGFVSISFADWVFSVACRILFCRFLRSDGRCDRGTTRTQRSRRWSCGGLVCGSGRFCVHPASRPLLAHRRGGENVRRLGACRCPQAVVHRVPALSGRRVYFVQRPNSVQSSISLGNVNSRSTSHGGISVAGPFGM